MSKPLKVEPGRVYIVTRRIPVPVIRHMRDNTPRVVKGVYKFVDVTCYVKAFRANASLEADHLAFGYRDRMFTAAYPGLRARPWNPVTEGNIKWLEVSADPGEHLELI